MKGTLCWTVEIMTERRASECHLRVIVFSLFLMLFCLNKTCTYVNVEKLLHFRGNLISEIVILYFLTIKMCLLPLFCPPLKMCIINIYLGNSWFVNHFALHCSCSPVVDVYFNVLWKNWIYSLSCSQLTWNPFWYNQFKICT